MRLYGDTKEEYKEKLLSVLFPRRCPVCGKVIKEDRVLAHPSCQERLCYITAPTCLKCGRPVAASEALCGLCSRQSHLFDRNAAIWEYSPLMKQSLYQFKYKNKQEYGQFYGREALRMYGALLERWGIEAVIPVPLHRSRQRIRGYNQAACFGKVIAKALSVPLCVDLIYRKKKTRPQKALGAVERSRNLQGAFAVGKKKYVFRSVLVVDDIFTTGSTLDSVAEVLKKAGVEKVYTLTIALGTLVCHDTGAGVDIGGYCANGGCTGA